MNVNAVIVAHDSAQCTRHVLEQNGLWDASRKLLRLERNEIAIPINEEIKSVMDAKIMEVFQNHSDDRLWNLVFETRLLKLPMSKLHKVKKQTPYMCLIADVGKLLTRRNIDTDLLCEVPQHWEVHGDVVLLPRNSFQSPVWAEIPELWGSVARCLKCQRLGRKLPISNNDFRSPQVQLLIGDNGLVQHRDNGIIYSYDVTKCMYSTGNITEKLRISKFDCRGEVVVDLYAGIGYFTLPYLFHALAHHVHACEWNPRAVEALKRNLDLNGVHAKCTIYYGDNRNVCPRGVADRVNLGLIPSSEPGWRPACSALKDSGGILHVHSNVNSLACLTDPFNELVTVENANCFEETFPELLDDSLCEQIESTLENRNNLFEGNSFEICSNVNGISGATSGSSNDKIGGDKSSNNLVNCKESAVTLTKGKYRHHWEKWATKTAHQISELLLETRGSLWTVGVIHIEHIKSYAPHIHHIVVDLLCKPDFKMKC